MKRCLMLAALAAFAAPQDSRWHILGPGGGGSLFHPTVSPHDARTVAVACDMTGAYLTTDAGENWRIFSLRDPVNLFAFDPVDPEVVYASTGVLYRSTDKGATWHMILPRPKAIARVTTGDDHASESYLVRDGPSAGVTAFAIDPDNSHELYAAVGNSVWYSFDTGATWRRIADLAGRMSALWIDRQSPKGDRTVFAAGPDAIYVRRDGKWSAGESPGRFNSVTAALPMFYAAAGGRVWSSEGGAKWRPSWQPPANATITTISAHPSGTVYAGFEGRTIGIAKSTNRGGSWETLPYGGRDAWLSARFGAGWAGAPYGIGCAPDDARVCYATDSGRVMRTTDGGTNWLPAYSKRSPEGNWTTNGIDVTTNYGVHFDPFDPRHMFISYTDIGLFASENGGASWHSATQYGVPREWVNTTYWLEFDPSRRGRIWAVMSSTHDLPRPKMWRRRSADTYTGGVVRSDDGGRTWRVQNQGIPPTAATHILRDPGGVMYVAGFGRGVYKSTDGGEHWTRKNAGILGSQPFAWRLARAPDGGLYLVVARRNEDGSYGNDGDGAVYRSSDAAEHWTPVPLPPGLNGPNGLAIDSRDSRRLYLAAWGRSTREGAVAGGIWVSTNTGATWRNTLDRDQHIYDVTVDPHNPQLLYAAGFEGNAWRSQDRGLTWTRIPGYDFKWGHRVVLDPFDPHRIFVTTYGGSVWMGPAE